LRVPRHHAGFGGVPRVPRGSGRVAGSRPVRLSSALSSLKTRANFFAGAHADGLAHQRLVRASPRSVVHRAWMGNASSLRGSRCCSTGHGVQARALLRDHERSISKERPFGLGLALVARLDLEHVDGLVTV